MTGTLRIRLSRFLVGQSAAQGAVATVYPLQDADSSRRLSVVIPAGDVQPRVMELRAGRYLVEALLPSGETVAQEVDVADGSDAACELEGAPSDHEWLSWQRLIGNVGRGASESAQVAERTAIEWGGGYGGAAAGAGAHAGAAAGDSDFGGAVAEGYVGAEWDSDDGALHVARPRYREATLGLRAAPTVRWIDDPAGPLRGEPGSTDAWSHIAAALDAGIETARRLAPRGTSVLYALHDDQAHQLYELNDSTEAPFNEPLPRRYLLVESYAWTELACAPLPWFTTATLKPAPVEVLVRAEPAQGEAATAIAIRDPDLGAALSYMTIGALPAARQLYDQAKEMLFGKVANPLAAAGGGYVLLATEPTGEAADWPRWIENLRNWFEWLPDGSIQYGWLKLKGKRTKGDIDEARLAFREAVQRGLPYYSIGLQRLVEGLTMFDGEPEMDRLLQQVRKVAWRANLQQPFTTLRLRG